MYEYPACTTSTPHNRALSDSASTQALFDGGPAHMETSFGGTSIIQMDNSTPSYMENADSTSAQAFSDASMLPLDNSNPGHMENEESMSQRDNVHSENDETMSQRDNVNMSNPVTHSPRGNQMPSSHQMVISADIHNTPEMHHGRENSNELAVLTPPIQEKNLGQQMVTRHSLRPCIMSWMTP